MTGKPVLVNASFRGFKPEFREEFMGIVSLRKPPQTEPNIRIHRSGWRGIEHPG